MNRQFLAAILFAVGLPHAFATAGVHETFEVTGSVIKNHDGDTITLKTDEHGIINVRLSGADPRKQGKRTGE